MRPAVIPDPVRAAARTRPNAPAIIAPNETVTYTDLDRRVGAAIGWLSGNGLGTGDRLAIYRPADVPYLVLLLAAFRAGLTVCPISMRQPAGTVLALLERIGCDTLVADPDPASEGLDVLDLGSLPPASSPSFTVRLGPPSRRCGRRSSSRPAARGSQKPRSTPSATTSSARADWRRRSPSRRATAGSSRFRSTTSAGLAILFRCLLAGATVVLPGPGTFR